MELRNHPPRPVPQRRRSTEEEEDLRRALHFVLLASRAPKASLWARCWIPNRRVRSPQ